MRATVAAPRENAEGGLGHPSLARHSADEWAYAVRNPTRRRRINTPPHAPIILAAALAVACLASRPPDARPATERGVALVELFTSEGCSSCPPADALLGRIAADAERGHLAVYALEFHVDYWDHLGWRDRFSSAVFTERQNTYAREFGLTSLYTPQMVVNGEREFVGSNEAEALRAIRDGLARTDAVAVTLNAKPTAQAVVVNCSAPGAPAKALLEIAWVDDRATSSPDRGENGGRTLYHVHVVRELQHVPLDGKHHASATLHPPDSGPGRVIVWLEAPEHGRILGAAESEPIRR